MKATTPGSSFALTRRPCFGQNTLSSSHCKDGVFLGGGWSVGSWGLAGGGVWESGHCSQKTDVSKRRISGRRQSNTSRNYQKQEYGAARVRLKKYAESEANVTVSTCIWIMWVGRVLADWVIAGQTGPSGTKEMHHVSFQGFPEVSRQMGMEMSRQRAHFNLARHS